jgi:hypothetical protein
MFNKWMNGIDYGFDGFRERERERERLTRK